MNREFIITIMSSITDTPISIFTISVIEKTRNFSKQLKLYSAKNCFLSLLEGKLPYNKDKNQSILLNQALLREAVKNRK